MRYTLGTTNAKSTAGKYKLTIKLSKKQLQETFLIRIYKLSSLNQRLVTDSDDEAIMEWTLPQGNYLIKYLESGTLKKQKLISLNGDTIVSLMDSYLPEYTSNKFMLDPYDDTFSAQLTDEAPEDWNIVFTESQTITFTDLHGTKAIDVFVVGGGGAGGPSYGKTVNNSWYSSGGGGGGGGQIVEEYNVPIQANIPYKIIIGAGGQVTSIGINSTSATGPNGKDSSAFGVTAKGGNGGHSASSVSVSDGGGFGGLGQLKIENRFYGSGGKGCALLNADMAVKTDSRYIKIYADEDKTEIESVETKDGGFIPFRDHRGTSIEYKGPFFAQGGGGGDGYNDNVIPNNSQIMGWSAIEIIRDKYTTDSEGNFIIKDDYVTLNGCEREEFLYGIWPKKNSSFSGSPIKKCFQGYGATYESDYDHYMNSKVLFEGTNKEATYTTAGFGAPNTGNGGGGGFCFASDSVFLPGDGGSGIVIIRNHRE